MFKKLDKLQFLIIEMWPLSELWGDYEGLGEQNESNGNKMIKGQKKTKNQP